LSLLDDAQTRRIQLTFPELPVVRLPAAGAIPYPVRGEVLVFGAPSPNLVPALAHGVTWAHAFAAGVDIYPLASLRGVKFTCSRGDAGIAISEWALAVMLAFEKQLPESWVNVAPDRWSGAELGTLYGRRLGLIGIGGIGAEVARRALAFGMHVTALRRRPEPSPVSGVDVVTELADLLAVADHVVISAPATPRTNHLLNARAFEALKPGAHIVNLSRGSLIDHDALRVALDAGQVARASLDVVEPEPLPADHWLFSHPKVRLSPHISWSAPWGLDRVFGSFETNVRRYLAGKPLLNLVDVEQGY
jgi:phosphoglycerate dehydrogenase-like enzyme